MVEKENPDLIILQPNFTDVSVSKAIEEVRRFSDIPMIVLGKDGNELEAVKVLDLGADEYIRSPYPFMELVARIVTILRRVPGSEAYGKIETPIFSGSLVIDPSTLQVFLSGNRITLTSTEFRLLHLLIKNRGTVVSHRQMERSLWGDRVDSAPLIKKYVQRLRRKLGDDPRNPKWIANVHGFGYRFVGPMEKPSEKSRSLVQSSV